LNLIWFFSYGIWKLTINSLLHKNIVVVFCHGVHLVIMQVLSIFRESRKCMILITKDASSSLTKVYFTISSSFFLICFSHVYDLKMKKLRLTNEMKLIKSSFYSNLKIQKISKVKYFIAIWALDLRCSTIQLNACCENFKIYKCICIWYGFSSVFVQKNHDKLIFSPRKIQKFARLVEDMWFYLWKIKWNISHSYLLVKWSIQSKGYGSWISQSPS